jgi:hypothetical protein
MVSKGVTCLGSFFDTNALSAYLSMTIGVRFAIFFAGCLTITGAIASRF